jgi:histidyl-tRNA synthetase
MARHLRRSGHSVELVEGKLKRSMELANKLGARFTMIVGETEMASGRYALKNMASGEQESLTWEEVSARLAAPNPTGAANREDPVPAFQPSTK